jgi:hypothetical protein
MFSTSVASASLCDGTKQYCGDFTGFARSSSGGGGAPTSGSRVQINPSAVPLDKALGIEAIIFDGTADLALVKGLGRVGAAISPSNSEETFFGPPGIELPDDYLKRKQNQSKYPSHKVTLATAFGLFANNRSGLNRFDLNFGVLGKYNKLTHAVTPGAGLSGVLGPLTFGYSVYRDQTQLNYAIYNDPQTKPVTDYLVETYSVGAYLNSVAVDYSILRMVSNDIATTSVLTGTLLIKKSITTVAVRRETSHRPSYNYSLQTLENNNNKNEAFFGFQYVIAKHFMIGGFYNYYVLHELSLGATLFF